MNRRTTHMACLGYHEDQGPGSAEQPRPPHGCVALSTAACLTTCRVHRRAMTMVCTSTARTGGISHLPGDQGTARQPRLRAAAEYCGLMRPPRLHQWPAGCAGRPPWRAQGPAPPRAPRAPPRGCCARCVRCGRAPSASLRAARLQPQQSAGGPAAAAGSRPRATPAQTRALPPYLPRPYASAHAGPMHHRH